MLVQLQRTLNNFLEAKETIQLKDEEIKKLENTLKENSKKISAANNRYGDARIVIVRYEASIFFKMFRLYLWIFDKYEHSRLKRILNDWKDKF